MQSQKPGMKRKVKKRNKIACIERPKIRKMQTF
jgi:hypothetical protein